MWKHPTKNKGNEFVLQLQHQETLGPPNNVLVLSLPKIVEEEHRTIAQTKKFNDQTRETGSGQADLSSDIKMLCFAQTNDSRVLWLVNLWDFRIASTSGTQTSKILR